MAGPIRVDVIVAEGYVLTELAGVVDVLRLSNRVAVRPAFEWRYRSAYGGEVRSSSDAMINTRALDDRPEVEYAFVLGNADPEHPELALGPRIAQYTQRGARVVLLAEAASRYIADKRDTSARYTTHWENRAILLEELGLFDTQSAFVSDTGPIITCAGMGAAVDVTLSIVGQVLSPSVMMSVADILLHERVRHHNTLQPFAGRAGLVTGDGDIDLCIARMQENIETPLSIAEVAEGTQVSLRSLERKFHKHLGSTPNAYYRQLRLTKANNLLLNTRMPIHEVGLACGFPNGFSAIYKSAFGMTPKEARNRGR